MMDTRTAVSGGGSFIEYEARSPLAIIYTPLKGAVISPQAEYVLLNLGEIHLAIHWTEHD
jgi:hypothetical protein